MRRASSNPTSLLNWRHQSNQKPCRPHQVDNYVSYYSSFRYFSRIYVAIIYQQYKLELTNKHLCDANDELSRARLNQRNRRWKPTRILRNMSRTPAGACLPFQDIIGNNPDLIDVMSVSCTVASWLGKVIILRVRADLSS